MFGLQDCQNSYEVERRKYKMTIQECYKAMGADYEEVQSRLRTEERIKKFVLKVLNDKSYDLLCTSIEQQNMEEDFRAAHTIKGIRQNLA